MKRREIILHELTAPMDIQPMSVQTYLRRALPQLPDWVLREAFSHRDVKMNGVRVKRDALLLPGAKVQVYARAWETGPEKFLDVVYEDDNILLVNKAPGISVMEDGDGGATLTQLVQKYAEEKLSSPMPPVPCHRLDNQTGGLILFAKTGLAEDMMKRGFRERRIHKKYICLVKGMPQPEEDFQDAWLVKNPAKAKVHISPKEVPGAQFIRTGYKVLKGGSVSRLEVDLITGRTHQIRAHMAYLGHPLVGDDVYGDRAFNKEQRAKQLMLWSTQITLWAEAPLAYLDGKSFSIEPPF